MSKLTFKPGFAVKTILENPKIDFSALVTPSVAGVCRCVSSKIQCSMSLLEILVGVSCVARLDISSRKLSSSSTAKELENVIFHLQILGSGLLNLLCCLHIRCLGPEFLIWYLDFGQLRKEVTSEGHQEYAPPLLRYREIPYRATVRSTRSRATSAVIYGGFTRNLQLDTAFSTMTILPDAPGEAFTVIGTFRPLFSTRSNHSPKRWDYSRGVTRAPVLFITLHGTLLLLLPCSTSSQPLHLLLISLSSHLSVSSLTLRLYLSLVLVFTFSSS